MKVSSEWVCFIGVRRPKVMLRVRSTDNLTWRSTSSLISVRQLSNSTGCSITTVLGPDFCKCFCAAPCKYTLILCLNWSPYIQRIVDMKKLMQTELLMIHIFVINVMIFILVVIVTLTLCASQVIVVLLVTVLCYVHKCMLGLPRYPIR